MSVDNAASITADSNLYLSLNGMSAADGSVGSSVDLLDRTRPRIYVRGNTPSATARERLGLVEFHLLRSGLTRPTYRPAVSDQPDAVVIELPPLVPLVVGDSRAFSARASRWTVAPGAADSIGLSVAPTPVRLRALDPAPSTDAEERRRAVAVSPAIRSRLTGRGQVALVCLLGILVAVIAGVTNAANAQQSAPPLTGATEVVVTVQPGDTLYSIAQEAAPQLDPQVVVASIKQVNGLTSADVTNLQPGQILAVPTS